MLLGDLSAESVFVKRSKMSFSDCLLDFLEKLEKGKIMRKNFGFEGSFMNIFLLKEKAFRFEVKVRLHFIG